MLAEAQCDHISRGRYKIKQKYQQHIKLKFKKTENVWHKKPKEREVMITDSYKGRKQEGTWIQEDLKVQYNQLYH